jgi:hypothetical protein
MKLYSKLDVVIICSFIILVISCGSNTQNVSTQSKSKPESFGVEERPVSSNSIPKSNLTQYYNIEKTSGNGYYLKVYVYLSDKSKLKDVTLELIPKYSGKWSQVLDIWYFDKKGIVDKWLAVIDNNSASDEEFNRLDKHMICEYEEMAGSKGDYDYNN